MPDLIEKCPDPDCAYAQEAAALHVLVSRLESRLDSARGELERTRERLREVEQERDEWREKAWRCHVESGADPDGDDARHLSPGEAIRVVREEAEAMYRRLRSALDSLER